MIKEKRNCIYIFKNCWVLRLYEMFMIHHQQKHDIELTFDLGANKNNFVDLDGFRRRICGYRFALESLIENGTVYQNRFLQNKVFRNCFSQYCSQKT